MPSSNRPRNGGCRKRMRMLALLPLCFLTEPSPSWAVREKWGSWLLIPNITQTMENSRKQAKARCWKGDQGPARGLGELQRSAELSTASSCCQTVLVQTLPVPWKVPRGESILQVSHQAPISRAATTGAPAGLIPLSLAGASCQREVVLVLPPARLALENPQLVQSRLSTGSKNGNTQLGLLPSWPHRPLLGPAPYSASLSHR